MFNKVFSQAMFICPLISISCSFAYIAMSKEVLYFLAGSFAGLYATIFLVVGFFLLINFGRSSEIEIQIDSIQLIIGAGSLITFICITLL